MKRLVVTSSAATIHSGSIKKKVPKGEAPHYNEDDFASEKGSSLYEVSKIKQENVIRQFVKD